MSILTEIAIVPELPSINGFGNRIVISDNKLAVAVSARPQEVADRGAVIIYHRSNDLEPWAKLQTITGVANIEVIGENMAISPDGLTLYVSSRESGTGNARGAVKVFKRGLQHLPFSLDSTMLPVWDEDYRMFGSGIALSANMVDPG